MSNPTTPFSWQMPTNTDLVTDLPADFEVFGQAVATSMADLLGGTTGQILSKTSATDMDFTWIANDQGDITGITAGTGISVTSPTGPVPTVAIDTAVTVDKTTAQTLTNKTLTSPALTTPTISTATTNGDLLYGTGSGALSRLGIGSTSQVLTVTAGVPSWAAAAGGGGMTVLASGSFDTATAAVTFNSLTQAYKDIYVVVKGFKPASGQESTLALRVNNDSTAAAYQEVVATSSNSALQYVSFTEFKATDAFQNFRDASQNNSSFVSFYIQDYTNATTKKFCHIDLIYFNQASTEVYGTNDCKYTGTAAITRLDLKTSQFNFGGGSYILYGVN